MESAEYIHLNGADVNAGPPKRVDLNGDEVNAGPPKRVDLNCANFKAEPPEHVDLNGADVNAGPPKHIDINGADLNVGSPDHNSGILSPICPKCEETFSFRYQLEWHYKWKHSSEGPPLFICTQCNKSCLSEFDAHWHQVKHGRQTFHACEKCCLRFQTDLELRQHHLVHRKPHATGFSCNKCEKTFTDRFSLQRHGELHSEAPAHPQNCLGCFSRQSFRVKHQKTRYSNCCHRVCVNERICDHGFYRTM